MLVTNAPARIGLDADKCLITPQQRADKSLTWRARTVSKFYVWGSWAVAKTTSSTRTFPLDNVFVRVKGMNQCSESGTPS
jgi:hypothetical protein